MAKTPEYTRNAIKAYNEKFDRIQALIPKGYKDIIKEKTGLSINNYINKLIEQDIKKYIDNDEQTNDCPF